MKNAPIKVLLVDDDEDDYILTRDWFGEFQTTAEFELTWVDSYQAARNAIANQEYDVYLVDYRLGVSSGLELLHEAQEIGFSRPIILLTGKGDQAIDIKAMKAGAADYLEKSQLSAPLLERSIRYAIERKETEQKIREQAALLDVATDAIFVCDLENRILFWNKAAEKLYGCTKDQVLGQKISNIWQDNNQQHQSALNILMKNGSWEGEIYQTTNFSKSIVVESRWTLVKEFDRSRDCILVVNTDITQKKQLESQFLRAQRLESIGTLASGIAHDLNNVLAPILMSAQLLESKVTDERSKRLIPILINNAKRGANLVKQVLSFTRGIEGDLSILSPKHSIREIQQVIKETFPKNIEVSILISEDLWMIKSDSTQIHQVLMNLCVNARDSMVKNGGNLTIRAENITIDENYAQMHLDASVGSYILISIKDTGVGIEPEILDRIFEPFFTTKEIGHGTGLGLSTVLGIVKSHSGFINVTSEPGRGSEFKIYLPAYQTEDNLVEQNAELPFGNGELILVVDDEDSICDVTTASLENFNYQAIVAKDGIEAIALYAEYRDKISVVLTDMIMPSMDGLTTIRTLQKINPAVKIIAVSGFASTEKINAASNIGVNAFLAKPYTAKQLLQIIGTVKNK
ncbi:MAG: response regulator [Cyanobacteria bacterium P01_A01_bin.45]